MSKKIGRTGKRKIFDMGKNSSGELYIDGIAVGAAKDINIDMALENDFTATIIHQMKKRTEVTFRIPVEIVDSIPDNTAILVASHNIPDGQVVGVPDYEPLSEDDMRRMSGQLPKHPNNRIDFGRLQEVYERSAIPNNISWSSNQINILRDNPIKIRDKKVWDAKPKKDKTVDEFPGRKIGIPEDGT